MLGTQGQEGNVNSGWRLSEIPSWESQCVRNDVRPAAYCGPFAGLCWRGHMRKALTVLVLLTLWVAPGFARGHHLSRKPHVTASNHRHGHYNGKAHRPHKHKKI